MFFFPWNLREVKYKDFLVFLHRYPGWVWQVSIELGLSSKGIFPAVKCSSVWFSSRLSNRCRKTRLMLTAQNRLIMKLDKTFHSNWWQMTFKESLNPKSKSVWSLTYNGEKWGVLSLVAGDVPSRREQQQVTSTSTHTRLPSFFFQSLN